MTRRFPAKDTFEIIEILILADASSVNTVTYILKQADFSFSWHQATTLTECNHISAPIDLVLYNANLNEITLDKAIANFSASNLQIPVLVINGESGIPAAVAAIKAGAADYLASEALPQLPSAIIKALSESDRYCLQSLCKTQSEQQLQKLISENADGIIVVDKQGIVQFVNPAALELLGKSSAELMGEALGFPVVNGDYLEVDIPISNNKTLVAQMRVSQIQWQGANAYVVSLRDITQRKQAEEERLKLLEEAQAANRAKDEFLAILSHELRTPLNPIVGWSQILVRGGLSEAQVKKGAEIIQRNARLQTQLIEDILDISRIIRGKLKLQICAVDLVNVIENALQTVSLAAQAKSIQIQTSLEKTGLVEGDATRLQQIVWNLLSNAVKFTPNGGTVEVKLNSKQDKLVSYAQIQVTDSGKGITPEFLPYVFDYFRQAESSKSRSEGGLGLGLAIVRRLVDLHGGDITASSPGLGKGATFTVLLPILARSLDSATKQSFQQDNKLGDRKVLVVDDDDDSRNLICYILETKGAEVKAVRSAVEALSVIEQFKPNILISDIGMPQVNGYELIQKIRQLPPNAVRNVKAIAISGYASQEDKQRSLSAGFDCDLNKPVDIDSLMDVLEN